MIYDNTTSYDSLVHSLISSAGARLNFHASCGAGIVSPDVIIALRP